MYSRETHPLGLVALFNKLAGPRVRFEFSKYVYKPRTIFDTREYIEIYGERIESEFERILPLLLSNQEIAIHSRLRLSNGGIAHIPMLDLLGDFDEYAAGLIKEAMLDFGVHRYVAYSSGRSFHIYGCGLIPDAELKHFFGRSLLLNLPGKRDVVDSRWIGHRLMGDYGSLRWTNNSGTYHDIPRKVADFSF